MLQQTLLELDCYGLIKDSLCTGAMHANLFLSFTSNVNFYFYKPLTVSIKCLSFSSTTNLPLLPLA